jgi:hypothetical protein
MRHDPRNIRSNPEAPFDGGPPDRRWLDPLPPPRDDHAWLKTVLLVFGFALILFGLLVYAFGARAHDYKHPENRQWFESLHSKDKTPCCDGAEANHIADMDWDTQCENNNFGEAICHYRVFLHNKWWSVPANSVVEGPNRDGSALVWEVPTRRDDEVISTFIRCFLPGAGG